MKKKYICVRFTPRNDAIDAVSDIIVLNRNKRPPRGYTVAGEVDGALIAFHVAPIASTYGVTQNKPIASTAYVFQQSAANVHEIYRASASNQPTAKGSMYPSLDDSVSPHLAMRSHAPTSPHPPLIGVPFKLGAKYALNADLAVVETQMPINSLDELNTAIQLLNDNYIFSTERIYVS